MAEPIQNQPVSNTPQQPGAVPPVVSPTPQSKPPSVTPNLSSPPRPNEWQVGVSASQMGVNSYADTKNHTFRALVKGAAVLIILFVLIGVGLYLHMYLTGMSTKEISNDGYTYTFSFYNNSSKVALGGGSTGYKGRDKVAYGKPFNTYVVSDCSQIGDQWRQAFTAQVNSNQVPVCTPNQSSFEMVFEAAGHAQGFTVVSGTPITQGHYQQLETIFNSVTVSANP